MPRLQRHTSAPPLGWFAGMPERITAIVQAWATGCYSMKEIAQAFEIHYATVSRIVKMKDYFLGNGRPDTGTSAFNHCNCAKNSLKKALVRVNF